MRGIFGILLIAAVLAGCQGTKGGPGANTTPPELSAHAAGVIAGDMVSRLAEQAAPATTTVNLEKDRSEFATALEAALKGWGYTVVTEQSRDKLANAVTLGYSILSFEDQILARLSTPALTFGRIYTVDPSGARPASPFTIQRQD